MNILISTCSQGLIYALLALGIYITFRILNFADMTTEGSLTLGGATSAVLITGGMNPVLSILIAGIAGSLAGFITGFLHTKLKIQDILSGILTMIALYSINIRIMGKANLSLLGKKTIFRSIENLQFFKNNPQLATFLIVLIICIVLLLILNLFFKTSIGLAIRATGDNEQMMRAQGGNTNFKKILALMISNFMCGIAGALIAQNQGYADINMGTGTIVIALASVVIGEALIQRNKILLSLISVVVGSICYRFIIFLVLNLGMNPSDLKLFTALVAAVLLALPGIRETIIGGVKSVKNRKFV